MIKMRALPWLIAGALLAAPGGAQARPGRFSGGIQLGTGLASNPFPAGSGGCYQSSVDGKVHTVTTAGVDTAVGSGSGYSTIDQSGTPLTQRSTVNFTGAGVSCVDNSGASRTDCTISGGGGGTLASTYSSTTPASNLMNEAAGGGPVIIKSYSPNLTGTPAFQIEDSSGTVRGGVDESGDWSGAQFTNPATTSGLTVGGSAPVLVCGGSAVITASNSTTAPSFSSGISVYLPTATTPTIAPPSGGSVKVAGTVLLGDGPITIDWNVGSNNLNRITSSHTDFKIVNVNTIGMYAASTAIYFMMSGGALDYQMDTTGFYPLVATESSGNASHPWSSVWSGWYGSTQGAQLTAAATITPTSGQHHVTGATSITTIATTNVPASANVTLTLIADGGTITWATGGNIAAGGTIAANKAQRFVYDSTATTWYPLQ